MFQQRKNNNTIVPLFDYYYPTMEKMIPYFWMPRFVNATDASARTLNIYKNKMNTGQLDDNSSQQQETECCCKHRQCN